MKKIVYVIFLFFFCLIPVYASSGALKRNSIITCEGKTYGYHGKDHHYHEAILKNGIWYANGDVLEKTPTCIINKPVEKEIVKLSKCVDGDTAKFYIKDKLETVRFLAIDTPEVKHPTKGEEPFGKEASNYTCQMLEHAEEIVLEYDNNSTKKDKYNRTLAWVFVDGKLLQRSLVEQGLAKVAYLYGDYRYTEQLQEVERKVKEQQIGIWKTVDKKEENDNQLNVGITFGCALLIYFS